MLKLGTTVPTLPAAADKGVSATVTFGDDAAGKAAKGVSANAEIPNMVYGVSRLRIKL